MEKIQVRMDEAYNKALAGESEYWDTFVAQWLMRGQMPGSIDFRIAFTQNRYNHNWLPFCLGIPGMNFRLKEIRYILDRAVRKPGARVLDLGCGAGWLSLELARLGADVTGVDISPTNLALGRYVAETNARNFPYLYQNFVGLPCRLEDFGSVEYVYGDLNQANLPAHEYDAVVVADSLHHISGIERLIDQIRYTLKPGGVFVGMDHAFATPRTSIFNVMILGWINDLYKKMTAGDPEWLYDSVIEAGKKHDWGVLNIDYTSQPLPGFEQFARQLFAEMLDVVRKEVPSEPLSKPETGQEAAEGTPSEESPFEDVSAERLAGVLLDSFQTERFSTICPFIQSEVHIPAYRSEKERLFQHYVACTLIELGEHAVERGQAVGQWFLFCMRPERPTGIKPPNPFAKNKHESDIWAEAKLELGHMTRYIEHLEQEIERKNAALLNAEEYQHRLEGELQEARKPRLPWKKRQE